MQTEKGAYIICYCAMMGTADYMVHLHLFSAQSKKSCELHIALLNNSNQNVLIPSRSYHHDMASSSKQNGYKIAFIQKIYI